MVALISKEFFLTEMVGRKVSLNSERIGKLADLVIVESGRCPK
jgi:magnesium transporter